ncbi:CC/Se motif family (seleno)protein [Clostridium sp. JS66]|uniref:CC/Se motif family (seleno)protein n=1 Tax=Clostridium sp. JS66 TaxID=3064705 RepID=UPI00298E54DC|nr:CC/Se motif family (seleno)protein [Clostridium sp. JS66]WPC39833.1 CC/Se motif family (seleno)protein [Clostridium sp. JS66]
MNIEINRGVKEYLSEKAIQDIYIEMVNRGACCSGNVFIPVVRLGKPSYEERYNFFVKDEITLYVPKNVNNQNIENIIIKVRNILGHKSLLVNGILAYKQKTYERKKY